MGKQDLTAATLAQHGASTGAPNGANGHSNSAGTPVVNDSFTMPPSAMAGTRKGPKAKSKAGFSATGSKRSGRSGRSGGSSEMGSSFEQRPYRVVKRRNSAELSDHPTHITGKSKGTLDTLSNVFGVTYTQFEPREDSSPLMRTVWSLANAVCFLPLLIKYYLSSIGRIAFVIDGVGAYILIWLLPYQAGFETYASLGDFGYLDAFGYAIDLLMLLVRVSRRRRMHALD